MIKILGGVVLTLERNIVSFSVKCNKCGSLNSKIISMTLMNGVTEVTTQQCSCCGSWQTIKMKLMDDSNVVNVPAEAKLPITL